MTQLHRVLAASLENAPLVVAICPGLCRTDMATGRGTLMSYVLWLASYIFGHDAAGGADTPIFLATMPEAECAAFTGKFVQAREVQPY